MNGLHEISLPQTFACVINLMNHGKSIFHHKSKLQNTYARKVAYTVGRKTSFSKETQEINAIFMEPELL